MHETDFSHEHSETLAERAAIARTIWSQDNVVFTTVGIDIGSSTSHLLFAKVALRRQSQGHPSRFVVIGRDIAWRSPILLTPFRSDGSIDAAVLGDFIERCYRDAGFTKDQIDGGAVILTGEAIKRKNARAIDELFAAQAGKFVCASAGHRLEARLAAHGSGAVALSKARGICLLHIDVGGGTTKLALIDRGTIVGLAAFAVGGQLIARDGRGDWTRIDHAARLIAGDLTLNLSPQMLADESIRQRIVQRLAAAAADIIVDAPLDPLAQSLLLTAPVPRKVAPAALTFSGGVAEYIFGEEACEFGDIAKPLARALTQELSRRLPLPLIDPGQRIRATVIGASQFTVQVSGKTIYLPDPYVLPVRNVPVVHIAMDGGKPDRARTAADIRGGLEEIDLDNVPGVAIAFSWRGDPEHSRLQAAGAAIVDALQPVRERIKLLVLAIDGDIGKTFGRLMHRELNWPGKIVCLDGVELHELDYIDVGELIAPPGVVPVVIKSLLFAAE
ncbi:MAG TPA: ethanolamine ammonia-lyase reactivating factor EutA [Bradyrhizobium sp.]|nr:ethanolamine ammonia-lyase reactivating factor EutA [Bradyrhizobium sp.]